MTCEAWPIVWPCDLTGVSDEVKQQAHDAAALILWGLSGRRIGVCTYVEQYRPPCTGTCGVPALIGGQWYNGVGRPAVCCQILLAHRPIQKVTAVSVWGDPLDPSEWSVSRTWLRRVGQCWPCGDDCADPPVEVTYDAGWPFPPGTAGAVGEVACEVVAGLQGQPCKLPSRAVSISRQGVTVDLQSADESVSKGKLGLPLTDHWLEAVNPTALDRPSRVYSPDFAVRS